MFKQSRPKKLFLLTNLWLLLALIFSLSFAGLFSHGGNNRVEAAASSTINFQARLLSSSGNLVPDGYYNVEFKLYSASSGGTAQWTETYYDSNGGSPGNDNRVRVVNGYLSVYLGSQTALPSIDWSQEEWLTLNIGGTTQTATPTWDGEMSPRLKLSAVPYAFTAGTLAKTTGANTSTLDWDTQTGANSILLPDESGTLCIQGSSNCGFASASGSGSYIQNGTSIQSAANFAIQSAASGSVGGVIRGASSQTADLLQLQNSGGTVLSHFDSSGQLAIGSASAPNYALDVTGSINASSYYRQSGSIVLNTVTGTRNTFLGVSSGNTSATGNDNTAVGYQALQSLSSGIWNTALGSGALTATSTGTGNTALGRDALNANTANGSTAIGDQALTKNTSGNQNTAIGELSLNSNTSGSGNTAVGYGTGVGSTGLSDITGNVLLGYQAGNILRTGADYNTLLGYNAGSNLTTGANNILIGEGIQAASATGDYQLNIGDNIIGDLNAGQIAIGASSVPANGVLTIGTDTTSASGGLYFGTDTNLYRKASGELKTDGRFEANSRIIASHLNSDQVEIGAIGPSSKAAVLFGSAEDTNLYRESAGVLSTDNALNVYDGLYVEGGSGGTITLYNGNESTTQTDFTQALTKSGLNIVTDFTDGAYTPGIFWSTQDNNATKPKAGIYLQEDGSAGTSLLFGTSDTYTTGVTNTALTLNPKGGAIFKNGSNDAVGFQVQNSTGVGLFTVNTSTGAALTSTLFIDTLGSADNNTVLCQNSSSQVATCNSSFVTGTSADYIQNGTSLQSSSNFHISGDGKADTSFTTPLLQSASATTLLIDSGTTGALNIGTGANAKTITIGNGTGATSLVLNAGTGAINIGTNAVAHTTTIGNGTGASSVVLQSGTGAINIGTNAVAHTTTIGNSTGASSVVIDCGTGNCNFGATATAHSTTIGSSNGASSTTLQSGTGNLSIQTQGTGTLGVGNNAVAQNLAIGNITGATGITERVGTGNYSLDGVTGSTYAIGASTTTGTITIGGTAQTGNITLGSSSGTNSVLIGNGTGATTVSIANANTAGAVNIGSAFTTGTISIGGTGAQTGTISLGTGTGAQSINLGTGGTAAKTVTLGSTASTSSTTIQAGSGGINLNNGTIATNATTLNLFQATATTINLGNAVGAGGINLAGGSSSTGCTLAGDTGNFTCSGAISTTATTGTQGWWTRSGTTLSPVNTGDAITTTGNISTTGSGTLSVAGTSTLTGNVGIGVAPTSNKLEVQGASGVTIGLSTTTGLVTDSAYLQVNSRARFGYSNGNIIIDDNSSQKGLLINLNNGTSNSTVLQLSGTTGAFTYAPTTGNDSTFAFKIQNASGNRVLNVDTSNKRVAIGDATAAPDSTLSVRTDGQNAVVNIYGITSGTDYGVVQVSSAGGLTNPSNRSLVLQPNGGDVTVGSSSGTNSTSKFQIQNATGVALMTADTTNKRINIVGDLNVGSRYDSRLFSDNFESGGFALWPLTPIGSLSTSTSTVHDGKYSAKVNPASTQAYTEASIAPENTAYARAWVYVSSQTSANADLLTLSSSAGGYWTIYRNGTTMNVYNGVAGTDAGSGGSFTTGAWHLIELRVTIGSPTGTVQAWLDGTQVVNNSAQNDGTNQIDTIEIGDDAGSRTFTAYLDDVVADTVATGTASSLNVDDSLHVGGSATFGNDLLVNVNDNETAAIRLTETNDRGFNLLYDGDPNEFILQANDAGARSDVMTVQRTNGAVLFQNSADSTSAFQVQNTGNTAALNIDTADMTTTLQGGTDTATLGTEKFTSGTSFPATTGWGSISGTGQSAQATHVSGTTALSPTPALGISSGNYYRVTWDIVNPNSGGTLTITMGGQTLATYSFDNNDSGTYTLSDSAIIQTSSTTNLAFTPNSAFTGKVTNVSVKQLTYNDAPVLVVNNTSGTANLEIRASSSFDNLFMGINSGSANVTGDGNLAVGTFTLQNNVSGSENTALGQNALQGNISGYDNTAVGFAALNSNTSGYGNIAVGAYALNQNLQGTTNIAIGNNSLHYNTDGYDNVGIGDNTLTSNTTGNLQVAIGSGSLESNTTGTSNTGLGYATLRDTVTGYNNTAAGTFALEHTTANENAAFGTVALRADTSGEQNSAFGTYSLSDNTTGSNNAALGYLALATNTTGQYNTALGDEADVIYSGLQNATAVGSGAAVGASNNIILGYNLAYGVDDKVGIGTSYAPNALTVKPNTYKTGTITQAGGSGSVVGSGTTFTSAMVGGTIFYSNGTTGTITAFTDATHVTSSNTTGGWSGASYAIVWGGFNVKSDATVLLQPTTNSTTAFQVLDTSGNHSLVVDTSHNTVSINATPATTTELYIWGGSSNTGQIIDQASASTADLLDLQHNSTNVVAFTSAGQIQLADTTGSTSAGIQFGGDTLLYRSAASTLSLGSNDSLAIPGGSLTIGGTANSTNALLIQNTSAQSIAQFNNSGNAITFFSGVTGGTFTTDIAGTTTAHGVCHSGAAGAAANVQFVACSGTAGADYAELYPSESDVVAGDVVMTTANSALSKDGKYNVPVIAKTDGAYESQEIGVVSEIDPNSDESNLTGHNVNDSDHPMPVALNGRVMTKVNTENGDIAPGDYITASSTPGVGMKATQAGEVIGRAMQNYSGNGTGQILVFVNPFYWSGPSSADIIQNGGSATFSSLNVMGNASLNELTADVATISQINVPNASITNLDVNGTATIGTLHITGNSVFDGDITLTAHIITGIFDNSAQLTTEVTNAAGTDIDGNKDGKCEINGNDTAGTITLTTGTQDTASGAVCKVTFIQPFGSVPRTIISAIDKDSLQIGGFVSSSKTDFSLNFVNAPDAQHVYKFNYWNPQ